MDCLQRAYKTKLRPTQRQRRYFNGCAGAARFVFNWALADREATYEAGGKPNKFEQKRRFNTIKDEVCPWIREYPYVLMQEEFDHIDTAFKNYFRQKKDGTVAKRIAQMKREGKWDRHVARCLRKRRTGYKMNPGYPRFKSRYDDRKSFALRGAIHIKNDRIKLPVIGWVNLAERGYIPVEGIKINFVTISERAGNWFISAQVEEPAEAQPAIGSIIGVDVGIKSSAVLSDGRAFDAPKTLYKYEKKLARLQRELSRRQKGSANRAKTKARIAKLHRKIADTRVHHLHNISAATVETRPAAVVIEDLNVKGMMKNGHLAKALSDAGMGELHRQITYKTEWTGSELIEADRWFPSSRMCYKCHWINTELMLSDRVFHCGGCGNVCDRDYNASKNLEAYGEAVKRGGLPVELAGLPATVKQEGGTLR